MIPLVDNPVVVIHISDDKGGIVVDVATNISPEIKVVVTRSTLDFNVAAQGRPYRPNDIQEGI